MRKGEKANLFKDILEMILNVIKSRIFILCLIAAAMFSILIFRVFNLQIVNSSDYLEHYIQKAEKEIYTPGTRGNIYDKNGEILAYNELTYVIKMEDILESSNTKAETLNTIINKMVTLIEKNGDSIINDFAVQENEGVLSFLTTMSDNTRLRFFKNIYGTETLNTEEKKLSESTAGDIYEYLKNKYAINDDYSVKEAVDIMNIRYNLSLNSYQKYITTTIATDVSNETVAAIYENEDVLKGVTVTQDTIRKYNNALYFAHIIGYTGKISEEQLSELKTTNADYTINDVVGKAGIEASYETTLAGNKGKEKVIVDSTGKVINTIENTNSSTGDDVFLTIDSKLQIGIYHLLEQKLAGILVSNITASDSIKNSKNEVQIPIKDVYFQLLNNNVIDIEHLSAENASSMERRVYDKFLAKQTTVLNTISSELNNPDAVALKSLSDELNSYFSYVYKKLSSSDYGLNVIMKDSIDTDDSTYKAWMNDEISLREFLIYAISQNWVDISKLDLQDKYADSSTIFSSLSEYIKKTLVNDKKFNKLVYKYLVKNGTISGNELCLILFDQNVLPADSSAYSQLSSGSSAAAFSFIVDKIRKIEITPAQLALDPCSASTVLTDPLTGNVLALVSYPSYDNNVFSGSINANSWNTLNDDLSMPLYNRATKTRTAPGSTFKPISAITGIENNVITATSTITTKGIFDTVTPSPKCWIYPGRHGTINVTQAIQHSCNCFFYEVGYRLSKDSNGNFSNDLGLSKLKKYGELFGLTETSGVEIEEYQPLFSTENSISSAIGQGSHSYTGVQLARYVNTLSNKGEDYSLTLIDKIKDNSGNTVVEHEPNLAHEVNVPESTWTAVRTGMRNVVALGSVRSVFSSLGVTVAGKTGTAQENANKPDHALFIGFAPYEEPKVSISVVIPNGFSSSNAAEAARNVLKLYFGEVSLDEVLDGTADYTSAGSISND